MLGISEILLFYFCAFCTIAFLLFPLCHSFLSHFFAGISNVYEIDNLLRIFYTELRNETDAVPKERGRTHYECTARNAAKNERQYSADHHGPAAFRYHQRLGKPEYLHTALKLYGSHGDQLYRLLRLMPDLCPLQDHHYDGNRGIRKRRCIQRGPQSIYGSADSKAADTSRHAYGRRLSDMCKRKDAF